MQMFTLNFLIYTMSGVWRPIEWSSDVAKLLYNTLTFFVVVSLFIFTLTQLLGMVLIADDIDTISAISLMLVSTIVACCKTVVILTRRDKIYTLVRTLLNEPCRPQDEDEAAIQLRFDEFIRSCTIKYSLLVTGSVTTNLVFSIPNAIRTGLLEFTVWLPYDVNTPLPFWMTFIHQIVTASFGGLINVATETLILGFMLQTCAQLEIFEYRMHKIMTSKADWCFSSYLSDSTRTLMSRYICHHLEIYKYAKMVNSIFNEVLFCQFFGSVLVLCTSVFFLSTHPTDSEAWSYLVFTLSMFVQIYIYCWSGNEVILKSSNIGNAIYQMDWTLLPLSERKDLLMIMKRSTIPIKFTSSFLITLSLQSYSSILKMSYSAFNVLQRG